MATIQAVALHLGIQLNAEKRFGPTTTLTVLGIQIDTTTMEARLESERRSSYLALIVEMLGGDTASRRESEGLGGRLSFGLAIIPSMRPFLESIWRALADMPDLGSARRCLSPDVRVDLIWWLCLLTDWNGMLLIQPLPSLTIYESTPAGQRERMGISQKPKLLPMPSHTISLIDIGPKISVSKSCTQWCMRFNYSAKSVGVRLKFLINRLSMPSIMEGSEIEALKPLFADCGFLRPVRDTISPPSGSNVANLARMALRVNPRVPSGVIPPSRCWWGDELDTQ